MYSGVPYCGVVAIPRRKVDAELHLAARRGLRNIAHHIALPAAPGALKYGVVGGLGGPKAETIVVLAGEDHAAHAGIRQRAHDGIGIELFGVEDVGVFVAVAPFLIGERVDREVQEGGEFQVVPGQLPRAGNGAVRSRGRNRARGGQHGWNAGQ